MTIGPTGTLTPMSLLKQRYRILKVIGTGGFAAVYKAEDTTLGDRPVAVKEMSQQLLKAQELADATTAFQREALMLRLGQDLSVPEIAAIMRCPDAEIDNLLRQARATIFGLAHEEFGEKPDELTH